MSEIEMLREQAKKALRDATAEIRRAEEVLRGIPGDTSRQRQSECVLIRSSINLTHEKI
jgi:hypothetical protein